MPKRTDIKKILIIGSGPIVIGQACEFDYSGTQACRALKQEGYEVVLVNSNPATIMTDPEIADRTYVEPLTLETATAIIEKERPDRHHLSDGFHLCPQHVLRSRELLERPLRYLRHDVIDRRLE